MNMEQFDREKAARVWQRVQNREVPEPLRQDPGVLIRAVAEQSAYYRGLSRAMPGKYAERFREYGFRQQKTGDCLKGICRLSGITPKLGAAVPVPQEPARRMLEKCCHGERRLVGEYTARMADPDWGRVYAALASEAAQRCGWLLEILGSLHP